MKVPVDECPAGEAIDAVARELVYWQICITQNDGVVERKRLCPSTSIMAASMLPCDSRLVHKRSEDEYWCGINIEIGLGFELLSCRASAEANTEPLAITRAFLKSKGVEFIEVPEA